MSAAILCQAVCISNEINKAYACGKVLNTSWANTSPFLIGNEQAKKWLNPEELKFEAQKQKQEKSTSLI